MPVGLLTVALWLNDMNTKSLIIVGAGGFGREVLHWAQDQVIGGNCEYSKICFLDDDSAQAKNPTVSNCYIGTLSEYSPKQTDLFVIAVGNPRSRKAIADILKARGALFGKVIHPTAIISRSCSLASGLIICPNSLVSVDVQTGEHVHINANSTIGHDTKLGSFTTLSSHVDVMGSCVIQDEVFFGSGARVLPKCTVAAGSNIGAGTTVQRSIKKKSTLYQVATRRL